MKPGTSEIIYLLGIVTYRGTGERVRYDITEVRGERTLGGVSIGVGL